MVTSELLTGAEVRQLVGVSAPIWMELIETQQVPNPVDVGGRLKWRRGDILEWVSSMQAVGIFSPKKLEVAHNA
ncbi:helix-turn-helix transcriptional regulator [Rosistilla oblonga]|uniref:helix-turn-helix transcriptional regulator n=1 Tax=Rosistilla oblonga TaxID=2527990 RepID=UPI003A96D76F